MLAQCRVFDETAEMIHEFEYASEGKNIDEVMRGAIKFFEKDLDRSQHPFNGRNMPVLTTWTTITVTWNGHYIAFNKPQKTILRGQVRV